ncbi:hypothetical protein SAMN02799624_05270 [Paenibacillus sp. UNC496MF]|nr:hypothetical protein SAMN02799624_05270 [Paenibacillus sp. UNC496MF]
MHIASVVANHLINAGSKAEIQSTLQSCRSHTEQHDALKMAADHILLAVESNIAQKNHQVAIWELSKLAIVEDELLKAERRMNHVLSLTGARL